MQKEMTLAEIEARLDELGPSPQDNGTVEMIVCRPDEGQRKVLEAAELDTTEGLVGDNWRKRGSRHSEDGSALIEAQIAIMNSRNIQAIEPEHDRWPLAGDQIFVDIDLSAENMPAGQRIAIGSAILEVTELPHNGCGKFAERFGSGASRFVNSKEGRENRRRGVNTRVIRGGTIRQRDTITKVDVS